MTEEQARNIAKIIASSENTRNYVLAKVYRLEGWPKIELDYEDWVARIVVTNGLDIP